MTSPKLKNILKIISQNLIDNNIHFALIGAIAMSLYGFSRYTSDIDFLTQGDYQSNVIRIMKKLGYNCYQKTDSFAQFDSELGIFGYIDFMFINTEEGQDILKRHIVVKDELLEDIPVIQPTDYIILKLMAIANNPDRIIKDEADILTVLRSYKKNLIPNYFEPLNIDRIYKFADRFRQTERIEKYFILLSEKSDKDLFSL